MIFPHRNTHKFAWTSLMEKHIRNIYENLLKKFTGKILPMFLKYMDIVMFFI
jgi:hypothetical protein